MGEKNIDRGRLQKQPEQSGVRTLQDRRVISESLRCVKIGLVLNLSWTRDLVHSLHMVPSY